MSKIPVVQSIRFAYTFTFAHLGAIIGLIWIPMLIVSVGSFFAFSYYTSSFAAALSQGAPEAAGQAAALMSGWSVIALVLYAMMYTAVAELALGLRKDAPLLHFALGKREMRVFGGIAALLAILIGFFLAYLAVVAIVAGLVGASGAAAAIGAAAIVGYLAIIFVLVRLSFLMIPATVAEDKVGLGRSWTLTNGNFWRIVAIGICTLLPLFLLILIAEAAILGPDAMPLPAGNGITGQMQAAAQQMSVMNVHLPALMGLSFVVSPLIAGLTIAPACYAYRALVPAKGSI